MQTHTPKGPSVPAKVPVELAVDVIFQLLCAGAATFAFGNALDHHMSTDSKTVKDEQKRLEEKLGISETKPLIEGASKPPSTLS